jgi:tetratricopeptide (TPR) repeat protein
VEHRLWGDSLLGYHLTNVFLHATSACVFVAILRRLALPGAWFAGFIFALHPVCVESVAWISEQKNTLSTLLGLISVLIYLHFDESRRPSSYGMALLVFLLSVLSKTVTITLPAVLLAILWWKRGRLGWKRDILPLVPWFVLGIPLCLPAASLERKMFADSARDFSLTMGQRGLLVGRAFWFYLGKLVWPANLMFSYPRWNLNPKDSWQYAFPAAALGLFVVLWLAARRYRGPLAAFLIFAGTLLPVLGVVNVFWFVISFVGDHLQYLSGMAIIALFASGAAMMANKLPPAPRRAAMIPAAGLLLALGLLTHRQSKIYRDAETLYRTTIAQNPTSWVAHYNLGALLSGNPDRQAEVIDEWEATIRIRPGCPEAQNNLGCLLASDPDRVPEAIEHFEAAIRCRPDFADAHSNLAAVLSQIPGQTSEAIEQFEAALQYDPNSAETHNNFGNMLMDVPGRLDEAIRQIQEALRINPNYAEAHWDLAVALARVPGRRTEATEQVRTAIRLDPHIQGEQQLLQHLTEPERTR